MAQPVLVVMAAGLGSRFGGLKQITPIGPNGQIILNYSIYDAWKAGFRRVVFIIKKELLDAFHERIGIAAEKLMQVDYVFQSLDNIPEGCTVSQNRTKPLGTGHAVYCVRGVVKEPFAVINADDFYGAEAFRCIYDYLKNAEDDSFYRYCMVGYHIENTLTENGTVSRGVCSVNADGFLTDIMERTAISRNAEGKIFDPEAGEIPEGTLVSMNMWGFTPSFLDELEAGLTVFLHTELPKNPIKGEYYLPFAVDHLIQTGKATAQVLRTAAQWYGITYQDDMPIIAEALRRMTENGIYPAE